MPAIKVENLQKYFHVFKRQGGILSALKSLFNRKKVDIKAVDNISFEIEQGELVGFIGPNGAGKTTTLKCLSGLLYPSSGAVSVLGFTPFDRKTDYLKKISLVMGQKNQLYWDLPAMDTFKLNKAIYEIEDQEFEETLQKLTSLLHVTDLVDIPTRQLSLGQRMKMELVASLIHKPKVLFLDEPTIGLDVVMQKVMRDFIAEYNKKFEATIILTSHYMDDVKKLCKRLIIIDHGKIIYDGTLSKLVEKYADSKFISVEVQNKITKVTLEQLGHLYSYQPPKAVFNVPRNRVNEFVSRILNEFKVEDLIIQEPEIEEIIRTVFKKGKS
ncbi:ATP-binding cassette domain-containing protein [Candidatus Gottesmanbacteria bacterium]|nr:ATP-binding cassette domain-containing protein [Candidatus Gottesmanbacteria bacterium]